MSQKTIVPAAADRQLAVLQKARAALAEARTLDQVRQIRDLAVAVEAYGKARDDAEHIELCASEIRLEAERKIGTLLSRTPRNNGQLRRGNKQSPRDATPKLSEHGIKKHESSRWQQAAALPEDVVQEYLEAAREKGTSVSSVGLIDFAAKKETKTGRRAPFQSDEKRRPHDFYATPPYATEALLSREKFSPSVWEPAAGDGAITGVLKEQGYNVKESDKRSGTDFLKTSERLAANIVTNPPYRLAFEFVDHARKLGVTKTAMLLPLDFLHGTSRYELFRDTTFPLRAVYVFARRVQFTDDGSAPMAVAWFVWDVAWKSKPFVAWIPPASNNKNGQKS